MRTFSRAIRLTTMIGAMALALMVGTAWSAEVTLVPSSKTISQGKTVTVAVQVDGAAALRGYQLDVKYNKEVGRLVKVEEGEFLTSDGTGTFFVPPQPSSQSGKNVSMTTLAGTRIGRHAGVSGSGTLARLTFEGTKKAGKGRSIKSLKAKINPTSIILVEN